VTDPHEPTRDEPTRDEPTSDEPTSDEPTSDEPTSDEPTDQAPPEKVATTAAGTGGGASRTLTRLPGGRRLVTLAGTVLAVVVLVVVVMVATRPEKVTEAELNITAAPSGELVLFASLKVNGLEQINRSVSGRYDAATGVTELLAYPDLTGAISLPDGYHRYLWADGTFLVRPEGAWAPEGLGDRWLIDDSQARIPNRPGLVGLAALRDAEPEAWAAVVDSLRKQGRVKVPLTGADAELYRGTLDWEQAVLLARTSMPLVSGSFENLEAYVVTSFPSLMGEELQAAVEAKLATVPATVEFWSIDGRPVAMRVSIDPRPFNDTLLEFSVTAVVTRIGDVGDISVPPPAKRIVVAAFNDELNAARKAEQPTPDPGSDPGSDLDPDQDLPAATTVPGR
jgi:hypothetical protein